jgi:3,4-dihydroxy 2-butanone 4-phosphate synthase / GTP cyclohydrolase II
MSKVTSLPARPTDGGAAVPGIGSVDEILAELRAGRMVLMLDDEDRENEGDLIMAAQHATPEAVAFMIRHTSGIICVPMDPERLARLELPQMVPANDEAYRTAFTVSVDYRFGTTTGVSSSDRAATIRALADPSSSAQDFARPGHIFPLRPRRGGVLIRAGHTEAAMDLCILAGLQPAGVLCELMNDDGSMARRAQIEIFAREHSLKIGTIADLIRYRLRNERSVERVSEQPVQTEFGEFRLLAYEDRVHRGVHLALVRGRVDPTVALLVRVHVVDTLRDLLGVRGAARAWTLRAALARVAQSGNGIVVILREPEGPQELTEALRSLAAPSAAAQHSSSASDKPPPAAARAVLRTYGIGAQILKDLGVRRMRVLSAPKQMHGISAFDLEVESYLGEET